MPRDRTRLFKTDFLDASSLMRTAIQIDDYKSTGGKTRSFAEDHRLQLGFDAVTSLMKNQEIRCLCTQCVPQIGGRNDLSVFSVY